MSTRAIATSTCMMVIPIIIFTYPRQPLLYR
jgi:hypothetical protein